MMCHIKSLELLEAEVGHCTQGSRIWNISTGSYITDHF